MECSVWSGAALGALAQRVVHQYERGHGFNHWHGAGEDARIVAASPFEGRIFKANIDRLLFMHDGGDRLESHLEINRLPVADSSLDAARPVGECPDLAAFHPE